jgi:ATP-binding protein involved in chromosome partitioning
MSLTKDQIEAALQTIEDPAGGGSVVAAGRVRKVAACDNNISVRLVCEDHEPAREHLRGAVEAVVRRVAAEVGETLGSIAVGFEAPGEGGEKVVEQPRNIPLKQASSSKTVSEGQTQGGSELLPGVKHVIAVGAGKGGVGKSTVSVTLAIALARQGHSVGLMDGDIYGPSVPTLLGLDDEPVNIHENMLQVFTTHGIKAMTIGKLVDPEKPLIWRGPMAHGAFKQLIEQTRWGELDYLIIDLPPGTGDVPLTMSQLLSLDGAVIVCTPQKVAQDDAVRAARMFQQMQIDVLGVVENMSYFVGDDGKEYDLFGRGGAEMMAQRMGLPYLGGIPISMDLRRLCDEGNPSAIFEDAQMRGAIEGVARRVEDEVALAAMRGGGGPVLEVS